LLFPVAWINKQHVLSLLKQEIAVSQHDYRALCRWYWLFRSKFGQIYHARLHGSPPPQSEDRQKTIVCVGTIGPRKGQCFLVDAFTRVAREFPDWKLMIIGRQSDLPMVRQIKAAIDRNQLARQVFLVDGCSNTELDRWFQTAGIFAMPSLFEGLGLSLQEAMFAGCACIGSAAGGMTDLFEPDRNGIMVAPGNVEQLAQGLRRLMGDEALRRRLGARAQQFILEKEMLAEKMVARYEQLYAQIMRPARVS
jgi:glycosyltransferase involved in cell wall biosynthesis